MRRLVFLISNVWHLSGGQESLIYTQQFKHNLINTSTVKQLNSISVTGLILLLSMLSSCAAVEGIFKLGMGFGIFIVLAIIIVIVVVVMRAGKNK